MAFGPRCNPGSPCLISLPKWPPCPGCCIAQHSNLTHQHYPELASPALLRCWEGKGHSTEYSAELWSNFGASEDGCTLTKILVAIKRGILVTVRYGSSSCFVGAGVRSIDSEISETQRWDRSSRTSTGPGLLSTGFKDIGSLIQ